MLINEIQTYVLNTSSASLETVEIRLVLILLKKNNFTQTKTLYIFTPTV